MKDDQVYLSQILESINKIESFSDGLSRADFEQDQKTQSAIIMQLILIGEVAKKISDQTKQKIDLPWKDIVGFRDVAIHNYFEIDVGIVWQTLQVDLPILKDHLYQSRG